MKRANRFVSSLSRFLTGLATSALLVTYCGVAASQVSVTTYHNDAQRTGWNPFETTLTPANVTPTTFGLIASVALDDQVITQPLVVANQTIAGQGVHNVVYVATANNTVYAIDSSSGQILKQVSLGAAVPNPMGCTFSNVGVDGTPTIDVAMQRIYLVAYTSVGGKPTYQLHALNLQNLQDQAGSPITISASHPLADGSSFSFNPVYERHRAALLESSGNIYAAFSSFCDMTASKTRGWVLGWNAGTLTPLGANELTNSLTTAPTKTAGNFFLSAIWMSGYGVAADEFGNLYFATGNSDFFQNTYTGTTNIQESVVKMPPALNSLVDIFTPSNEFTLDQQNADLGSGGVMVLPDQPGPNPHLAVAAGKDGRLFIINRDDFGGFNDPDIPAHVIIRSCFCGESYYQGSDGVGRVISSGGHTAETWTVNTALTPALSLEAHTPYADVLVTNPQDPGFFTSVSSNGTTPKTAIIWAVSRPTGTDNHITLYAFNGTAIGAVPNGTLAHLWAGTAGFWPNLQENAILVPTVANGMVYVASYRQLAIFGLTGALLTRSEAKLQQPPAPPTMKLPGALFWGTIESINHSRIGMVLRTGKLLQVDLGEALKQGNTVAPVIGENVRVNGELNAQGVLEARFMWRAKGRQSWSADISG